MSFEFYKQAINELNNYEETLPRFPNINQNFTGFNPFSNRNDRIHNKTIQRYIQSISKSFVDLDNIAENDQNIIRELADISNRLDDMADSIRPKPKHFKNVKGKPEVPQKPAKTEERSKTPTPQTTNQAKPKQEKQEKQETQQQQQPLGNISRKLNFLTGNFAQNPPTNNYPSITEQVRVGLPQPEIKPFLTEQDYISVSALQEVKEPVQTNASRDFSNRDNNTVIIKEGYSGKASFPDDYINDSSRRVESLTNQNETGSRLINLTKVSYEKENKPNPFSSLGDKLNSLISERKAIEKQVKNEFIKKPVDSKK